MSLAYVFWHWPADGTDRAAYERDLKRFQEVLALGGRDRIQTYRLDAAPWDGAPPGPAYEDWYPVSDWTDLGALNEQAVSGARQAPHDAVAHRAGDGIAGIYRLVAGEHAPHAVTEAAWLHKPRSSTYADFIPRLAETGATVWQRQMTLGPTPEFAVLSDGEVSLPWPARRSRPTAL